MSRAVVLAVLDLVDADLRRTAGRASHVRLVDDEWGLRLSGDGDCAVDLSLTGLDLAVAVARAAQDSLVEQVWRAGPLCLSHDRVLQPEPEDGRLVWRCATGHVVAPVGGLQRVSSTW